MSNNAIEDDVCACGDDNGGEQGVDGDDGLRTDSNDSVTVCGNNVGTVYESYVEAVGLTASSVNNIGEDDVHNVGIVGDGSINIGGGGDDDETGGGVYDRDSIG